MKYFGNKGGLKMIFKVLIFSLAYFLARIGACILYFSGLILTMYYVYRYHSQVFEEIFIYSILGFIVYNIAFFIFLAIVFYISDKIKNLYYKIESCWKSAKAEVYSCKRRSYL